MSERLTKQALKLELSRRIEYFEKTYNFDGDTGNIEFTGKSHHLAIVFGRYRALLEMRSQIEMNLFIGGYVS